MLHFIQDITLSDDLRQKRYQRCCIKNASGRSEKLSNRAPKRFHHLWVGTNMLGKRHRHAAEGMSLCTKRTVPGNAGVGTRVLGALMPGPDAR